VPSVDGMGATQFSTRTVKQTLLMRPGSGRPADEPPRFRRVPVSSRKLRWPAAPAKGLRIDHAARDFHSIVSEPCRYCSTITLLVGRQGEHIHQLTQSITKKSCSWRVSGETLRSDANREESEIAYRRRRRPFPGFKWCSFQTKRCSGRDRAPGVLLLLAAVVHG